MRTQIHFKFVAFALVLVLLAVNVPTVLAFPPLPSSFFGVVKMNGANVAEGTVISARINGVQYTQATVSVYNGDTIYGLDIPGDDVSTPGVKEGGAPNDTVVFYIGAWEAYQTASWQSGSNVQRDLSVDVLQATHSLASGWNLTALSVDTGSSVHASAALNQITGQGGNATEVDRWLNGGWDAYVRPLPFNDFVLELGKGYFVRTTSASTWTRTGRVLPNPLPITLNVGWNLVGFPKLPRAMTALDILNGIQSQTGACPEMDRWSNGGWSSFLKVLPLFNNFSISNTEGYFIRCTQSSTYTPS